MAITGDGVISCRDRGWAETRFSKKGDVVEFSPPFSCERGKKINRDFLFLSLPLLGREWGLDLVGEGSRRRLRQD